MITPSQLDALVLVLQVVSAGIIGLLSRAIVRFLWQYIARRQKPKHATLARTLVMQYASPIAVYTIFTGLFLIVSLGFYYYLNNWTGLKIVLPLSVLLLLGQYAFIITRQKIAYPIVVLPLGIIWVINYMESLAPFLAYINAYSITLGDITLTPIGFLKSIITVLIFFWLTSIISGQVGRRIKKLDKIKPATREILTKAFDVSVYVIAGLFLLNVLGINLSTLTVLGGAIGVGVGFGLQKIISNFISGIILLVEKSIELDDLIEMDGGIYGFIKKLGSRYTVIEMFDGKEVLIPNEDFITNRVTNWTFSNKIGRVEISVGVAYQSDLNQVKALILEAATSHPKCAAYPPPQCFLREFGDSSVNFLLHFFACHIK